MMGKLALRNLAAHRLRLVFTTVAVVLGVAFVAGAMIFRDTAAQSFDTLFGDLADSEVVTVRPAETFTDEQTPPAPIPASLLTTIEEKAPGAGSLYGQIEGYAAIVRPDGTAVGGTAVAQRGRAYVERADSKMRITSGQPPTAADDVVVEEHTAAEGGVAVGDSIVVVTQYETRTMRVVGIFTLGDEWLGDVTYVGFAPDVAERILTEPGHYTAIWVQPRAGVSAKQLADEVRAALPPGYEVKTGAEQAKEVKEQVESLFSLLGQLLLAFAAISVIVGSFIVFNTFTMLMAQRTRELALLRAIGASRGQLIRVVLIEAMATGLLGATLGILAGVGVARLLTVLVEQFGSDLPEHHPVIAASTVFWSYVVGVGVTALVTYLPARRASRIPPVAAMRDDLTVASRRSRIVRLVVGCLIAVLGAVALVGGVRTGGENGAATVAGGGVGLLLAAILLGPYLSRPTMRVLNWPVARLAGAAGELSRENARRDPRRSAATAGALMVGLALVSATTVVANSVRESAAREFERQFGADYVLEPQGLTGFSPAAVDRVADVPGVSGVAPVRAGTLEIAGSPTAVVVADPVGLGTPVGLRIESGTADLGDHDLLVQRTLADERGWTVGSEVRGRYPDGAEVTFRIVGIFTDNQVVNGTYIVNPTTYREHVPGDLIQRAYVTVDDDATNTRDAITSALREYPGIRLSDRGAATAGVRDDVDQVLNIVLVLLLLSIIIAAVGIVNTLGLSVVERTREIGLLRAVGMSRRQVRAMIRYESVAISLFGAVLGIGLGVVVGYALQRALESDGVAVLDVSITRLVLYLLSAVAIGVIAAIWPAWRAARMNVLAAIHHE